MEHKLQGGVCSTVYSHPISMVALQNHLRNEKSTVAIALRCRCIVGKHWSGSGGMAKWLRSISYLSGRGPTRLASLLRVNQKKKGPMKQ